MTKQDLVRKLQSTLNAQGEALSLDGVFGPATYAASEKFEIEIVAIRRATKPAPSVVSFVRPIDWARTQLGQKEIAGTKDNPAIVEYHKHSANLKGEQHDEVPWCSSFVNAAADACGMEKTNHALASSWDKYNVDSGDIVEEGDIITIRHASGGRHVTLANRTFHRKLSRTFEGLGGNQSNQVCVSVYPTSEIVACRKWKTKG
jgi:uncharacterized protein (TIGR02594 family)